MDIQNETGPQESLQPSASDQCNAENFLDELKDHLNEELPLATARVFKDEVNFLKLGVVPSVHSFLIKNRYTVAEAKGALLAEGYKDKRLLRLVSGTPASKGVYPFKKGISRALKTARIEWWKEGKGQYASCPDFALCLPHRIVFEGKLFRNGESQTAKTQLVEGVFECSFYRGLSTLLSRKGQDSCGYDFACLVAYDASDGQSLKKAWKELREINDPVVRSLWENLRAYVMVLPGD